MEISLLEEDAKVEIIRGHKNLKYKVKHNGKNINLVPRYMQWLNLMKMEKGENGIITYCTKCNSFLYLENLQQKHSRDHICCDFFYCADFCEYCGELYNEFSICCLKKCFYIFKYLSYNEFFVDFGLYILFIPITALIYLFVCFFKITYSKRIKKSDDINHIEGEGVFESKYGFSFFILFILFAIVYSIVFCVPYIFTIYFFQLFIMIKMRRQKISDEAINILRY